MPLSAGVFSGMSFKRILWRFLANGSGRRSTCGFAETVKVAVINMFLIEYYDIISPIR